MRGLFGVGAAALLMGSLSGCYYYAEPLPVYAPAPVYGPAYYPPRPAYYGPRPGYYPSPYYYRYGPYGPPAFRG